MEERLLLIIVMGNVIIGVTESGQNVTIKESDLQSEIDKHSLIERKRKNLDVLLGIDRQYTYLGMSELELNKIINSKGER